MKIKIALVTIYFVLICSCNKDGLGNVDYFSFGKAYGFCIGNCATFFQIKDDKIYPDDMDRYLEPGMKFKPEPLGFEEYNAGRKLIEDFPPYLAKNPDQTFGCPDCADQGGLRQPTLTGHAVRFNIKDMLTDIHPKLPVHTSKWAIRNKTLETKGIFHTRPGQQLVDSWTEYVTKPLSL